MESDEPKPKPREPRVPAKVGRTLGKAIVRLKKTKVWQDTEKAYQEGLEGKR